MRFALIRREKTTKKVCFFSNFSKSERFFWKLSPIEEYNRNPAHSIDIKRHPVILDTQLAHLELVNPRTAPRAKTAPPAATGTPPRDC
jgi:hypothetical protein